MRTFIIMLCSLVFMVSSCLAASVTTESDSCTNGNSTLAVEYPVFEMDNPEATAVANGIMAMDMSQLKDSFMSGEGPYNYAGDYTYTVKYDYEVTFQDDNYVSMIATYYSYAKGAAYPRVTVKGSTFSTKTGQRLTFDQFYDGDVESLINNGVYLYRNGASYNGNVTKNIDKGNDNNFYINGEGTVCLLFSADEIAAHAAGPLYIPVKGL